MTIPASVQKIDYGVLYGPNNIQEINFEGTLKQWLALGQEQEMVLNSNDVEWYGDEPIILKVNILG